MRTLRKHGYGFNAIACEPREWEILQKVNEAHFEGSTRSYEMGLEIGRAHV